MTLSYGLAGAERRAPLGMSEAKWSFPLERLQRTASLSTMRCFVLIKGWVCLARAEGRAGVDKYFKSQYK